MSNPDSEIIQRIRELRLHEQRIKDNLCIYHSKRACKNANRKYNCIFSDGYIKAYQAIPEILTEIRKKAVERLETDLEK